MEFSFNLTVSDDLFLRAFSIELHRFGSGYIKTYFYANAVAVADPTIINLPTNTSLTCPPSSELHFFHLGTSSVAPIMIDVTPQDIQKVSHFIVFKACLSTFDVNKRIQNLNGSSGMATLGVVKERATTFHTSPGAIPPAGVYGAFDSGTNTPSAMMSFYFPVNTMATLGSFSRLGLVVNAKIN